MMWRGAGTATGLQPDDQALVRRLRAGDERAFEEFFEASFQPLYRFALSRVDRNSDLAKDLAQSALCKAVEKLDTYRGEAPLFSWLCTFCRFEISAHFRRERRAPFERSLPEDRTEIRAVLESGIFDGEDPERQALRREVSRLVHVAVDHLPAGYGRALDWRYLDGLPVSEIAARLEITYKAAESLLSRARQAFRQGFSSLQEQPDPTAAGRTR